MPFQSEKQRRYLWANEPEIAREWTDRYGANQGGITRLPFAYGPDNRTVGEEMISIGTPLEDQMAELTDSQKKYIDYEKSNLERGFKTPEHVFETINNPALGKFEKNTFNPFKGAQEPTTKEEYNNYLKSMGIDAQLSSLTNDQYLDQNNLYADAGTFANDAMFSGIGADFPNFFTDAQANETLDQSEFIDDANYIPKWNEYTVDPEYNVEGDYGDVYNQGMKFGDAENLQEYFASNPQLLGNIKDKVGEQISPFKQWSRDFWDQPGKNLWKGANIAFNPFYKDNPLNMGVGLLAQNIDFPDLRGGQTQDAYNKARQERILAKRIRQRKSDKTQANMERWRDEERKRKFEEETKRMQEQLWQQQAQQVQQNIQTYGNRDRPNTGMNRPGGGRGQSPTGGDVSGTPFAHGGLAGLWHKR